MNVQLVFNVFLWIFGELRHIRDRERGDIEGEKDITCLPIQAVLVCICKDISHRENNKKSLKPLHSMSKGLETFGALQFARTLWSAII